MAIIVISMTLLLKYILNSVLNVVCSYAVQSMLTLVHDTSMSHIDYLFSGYSYIVHETSLLAPLFCVLN